LEGAVSFPPPMCIYVIPSLFFYLKKSFNPFQSFAESQETNYCICIFSGEIKF
jgi:hypothetical protein